MWHAQAAGGQERWRGWPAASALAAAIIAALLVEWKGVSSAGVTLGELAAVFVILLAIPARYRLGVVLGVLVLGGLDALPGTDLDTHLAEAGLYDQDIVVIAMCGCLAIENQRAGWNRLLAHRLGFAIVLACLAVVCWWFITLYRTANQTGLSLNHSANFGHDFLFFMIMIPLFCGTLQRRDTRNALAVTAGIGVIGVAGVYSVFAVTHKYVSSLLHTQDIRQVGAITRLYTPAADLFPAAFALGLGAALFCESPRARRFGGVVAAVNLLAILLSLTRATYLGVGLGLIVASAVWLVRPGQASRIARRRLSTALVGAVLVVALGAVVLPSGKLTHTVDAVTSRLGSVVSSVTSSNPETSTVVVRSDEASLLEQRLGDHALLGLGFVSPRDIYDPSLPFGTIRNTDVGLLNVTMTMGIVGTVLYFIPLLLVAFALLVVGRRRWTPELGWLGFATTVWCVTTLATAPTLVTLFSVTGVVCCAAMIGLGAAVVLEAARLRGATGPG